MSDPKAPLGVCRYQIWETWYRHTCHRPVKHRITTKEGEEYGVCGVHRRVHERTPLTSWNFKP